MAVHFPLVGAEMLVSGPKIRRGPEAEGSQGPSGKQRKGPKEWLQAHFKVVGVAVCVAFL